MGKMELDLSSYWVPFTPNRHFKSAPRILASAKDMHYTTDDGRQLLDGTSGLWCVSAGHCRKRITDAVKAQLDTLDYAPSFQVSHPVPFMAAQRIADPVMGSTGALIPPKGYLQRLREICDKHNLLLIFDEVITGFGRLGTPFASQYFDVIPDMFTFAKSVNNATVPMGGVVVKDGI